jgi:hypothetical protein
MIPMIRKKYPDRLQIIRRVSESFYDNIYIDDSSDAPLKSIIDTPLTDSLINEIFHEQNNVNYIFVIFNL